MLVLIWKSKSSCILLTLLLLLELHSLFVPCYTWMCVHIAAACSSLCLSSMHLSLLTSLFSAVLTWRTASSPLTSKVLGSMYAPNKESVKPSACSTCACGVKGSAVFHQLMKWTYRHIKFTRGILAWYSALMLLRFKIT